MWKEMGAKSTLLLVLTSFTLLGVGLSSPSPKPSPTTSSYSRRISIRSKSPANLHLQTLRSSRQIPSPPALYSAPKAPKEASAPQNQQVAPPPAYGSPGVAEDEVSATTETVTEESLEGASTSAPESDGEVIEAENEVSSGTERTEYLPPPSTNKRKMGRNRVKDQQMVENSPFHQIQIHVVPPHLSNQQDDHTSDISSYGVPHMMMMGFGSRHEFLPQPESRSTENGESGLYLPPQGRSVESSAPAHRNEEQNGSYGPQQGREQNDQELAIGMDKTQPPSKEYETPRRDEPQENPASQIYHVHTAFSHSSTNLNQNSQGYVSPSQERAPQSQTRSQYSDQGQQSQGGYPELQQNQNQYPQFQSERDGYQEPHQTRNQQIPQFHQEQSQPQQQSQEQYRGQNVQQSPESDYQQQISGQGYQPSPFNAPFQYESNQGDYKNQPSYPQQSQDSGYFQNQITHEQPQNDAIVVQGLSSPQTQSQQQFDYPMAHQNEQPHYAQPQPQTYGPPSQQQHFNPEIYSQPQQSPTQPSQYNAPFESQRQPSPQSPPSFGGGYSQQSQNGRQPQPQSPTYDQQPLTSNSNLRQPQQNVDSFPSGNQLSRDAQGYPESRPQPQKNQSPNSAQSDGTTPSQSPSQYFQGNFFPAQPQFRSNSLDFDQMEELEGLNGRIVDAALLARVNQIIEEHEREQKALLAKFNSNSPSPSGSNSEYGSSFPSTQRQPTEGQQSQRGQTAEQNHSEQFSRPQPQQRFGGGSSSGGYQDQAQPATSTNNNGIQYQKAVLSQQFTETSPNHNSPVPPSPQFPQQSTSPTAQGDGRLVPAPQFGPQPQGREITNNVPKPVYGVPLAPVIGLDSNENFKVVDESLQDQGLGRNSYGAPLSNNFLQSRQSRPFYGRNRRRVVARVVKLANSSPRVSIPSYFL